MAGLIDTPKGRAGRRRRAFTLAQAAALIVAARSRPVLEWHGGLKDPRRPASLMHAYIVVSLMAGMRPEEARAIGWEQDVRLDGNPPSIAGLRADRAGGDTKTPKSRRALKLAQMAAGALGEWQADQAAEREAAGSRWQDTGLVFTTATGTPLAARPIRKMFQDVCERAGLGRDWAPRDLRHTFVSLLSDDGMAIEKIARLVGHASSHITETGPAELMHACITLSLLCGLRTEEARALQWAHVDLNGDPAARPPVPPHVAVWRSVRVHGDTKTERSRRTLALPSMANDALRAWADSQAEEQLAAGDDWQDTAWYSPATTAPRWTRGTSARCSSASAPEPGPGTAGAPASCAPRLSA